MEYRVSVGNLAYLNYASGDLEYGLKSNANRISGTMIHQIWQEKRLKEAQAKSWEACKEKSVRASFCYDELTLHVFGRMDMFIKKKRSTMIEEFKSCGILPDEPKKLHLAQLKIYAALYCMEHEVKSLQISLCYIERGSMKHISFLSTIEKNEAITFLNHCITNSLPFFSMIVKKQAISMRSIKTILFPHASYRPSQRKMAVSVYQTIKEEKNIVIEAPTGTGKTISALFPAIKSLFFLQKDKIFYLTPKDTIKLIIKENLQIMTDLSLFVLFLYAKEKICIHHDRLDCHPERCPYAKNFYSKISSAIFSVLSENWVIDFQIIQHYSQKFEVCPFELSLLLTDYMKLIVCDYNYIFDPKVSIKEFAEPSNQILLIDEAHNLVDRARKMITVSLSYHTLEYLHEKSSTKKMNTILQKAMKHFPVVEKKFNGLSAIDPKLIQQLYSYKNECDHYIEENPPYFETIKDAYFLICDFLRIVDLLNDGHVFFTEKNKTEKIITIFSVDPSYYLKQVFNCFSSSIVFSATLQPISYFKSLLALENAYTLILDSSFLKENLLVMLHPNISTKYKVRAQSYQTIARLIEKFCLSMIANYLIFFPSYSYMNEVVKQLQILPEFCIIKQSPSMTAEEREEFIGKFRTQKNTLAFAVMGGVFSEGIDLIGDELSGIVIVGPGIPKVSHKTDLIKQYFDRKYEKGNVYAYLYPGMQKVLQAAGRLIRSEYDKGALLLIDDRFLERSYRELFPKQWENFIVLESLNAMQQTIKNFFLPSSI